MRKRTFFSLEELNRAILEILVEMNNKPFQILEGSRRSMFELAFNTPKIPFSPNYTIG